MNEFDIKAAEWDNRIWFANKSDIYKFSPEGLKPISEGYTSVIKNMLQNIGAGYSTDISSVWDNKFKEDNLRKVVYSIKDKFGYEKILHGAEIQDTPVLKDVIGFGSIKDLL